jgi:tRNA (cytidine32/uridine32-2'-O)-methyltransferase
MVEEQREWPAVVLVRPREDGNVGAAARAMANMGLARLILVEPVAEIGKVARAFAVGARPILEGSGRAASLGEALAPFRRVVATTSTRDRSLQVPLLTPRELPAALALDPPGTPTALVFGPEVGGLTNDELALASLLVHVPCSPVQPTLNLSQAVLLLAYELYQARGEGRRGGQAANGEGEAAAMGEGEAAGRNRAPRATAGEPPELPTEMSGRVGEPPAGEREPAEMLSDRSVRLGEPPASTAELDGLFGQFAALLGRIGFARDDSFPGVLRDLRQLAARAGPTSREVRILRGICRRTGHAVERGEERGDGSDGDDEEKG